MSAGSHEPHAHHSDPDHDQCPSACCRAAPDQPGTPPDLRRNRRRITAMNKVTVLSRRITEAPSFDAGIVAIIILNAVLLGVSTSPEIDQAYGDWLDIGHYITLAIFIVEEILKMTAASPRVAGYFRDGWNVFDFLVIVFGADPGNWTIRHDRTSRALASRASSGVDDQGSKIDCNGTGSFNIKRRTCHASHEYRRLHLRHHRIPSVR